jgi:DNA end-binding protein Ku
MTKISRKRRPKNQSTSKYRNSVEEKEIDSIYFESPYYVQPDKSGTRAYALLREALKKDKQSRAGDLRYASGGSMFALFARRKDVLILNRLRFPEEIRGTGETKPAGKPKARRRR